MYSVGAGPDQGRAHRQGQAGEGHAGGAGGRTGLPHRHGRRGGEQHGAGQERPGARLQRRPARRPRDGAAGQPAHAGLRGTGRRRTPSSPPTTWGPAATATPCPRSWSRPGPSSTCGPSPWAIRPCRCSRSGATSRRRGTPCSSRPPSLQIFETMAARENVPLAVVGRVTGDGVLVLYDSTDDSRPVELPLDDILGQLPPEDVRLRAPCPASWRPWSFLRPRTSAGCSTWSSACRRSAPSASSPTRSTSTSPAWSSSGSSWVRATCRSPTTR